MNGIRVALTVFMLNYNFLRRAFQAVLLCLFLLPGISQAQQRDKVTTLDDDLRSLQKDFFSLQKEVIDLEKTVARSGISDSTKNDLAKLNEIDVLKANIDKLSAQIETIKNSSPAPAPASSSAEAGDPAAISALKSEVGSLSTKVDGLQTQIKKLADMKSAPAPAGTAPAAVTPPPAPAAAAPATAADPAAQTAINMMWTLITGFLVMFMQAGFALVEAGFTRQKNAGHTMSMNFMVYALGMFGYWVSGFAIQFGGTGSLDTATTVASVSTVTTLGPAVGQVLNTEIGFSLGDKVFGLFGGTGFMLTGKAWEGGIFSLFLFQMVFMDTTATVPTGAMAERWKFLSFVVYALCVGAFIYPLYGNWVWGGGWLAALGKNFGLGHGMVDFAGSSVVHLQGGVLALVGSYILGARYGKYNKDGSSNPIPGHNVPMAMLGTFILAFGWFGFNPGSTLAGMDGQIGIIASNTMLAGTTGCMASTAFMWIRTGKPDMSFMCNGLLAGLVAITAPCAFVESWAAAFIGAVAGIIVVYAAVFVEETLKIDDPVGAVAVHGFNGAWGVLSLGLLANGKYGYGWNSVGVETYMGKPIETGVSGGVTGWIYGDFSQFCAQITGTTVCIITDAIIGYIVFKLIDKFIGLRTEIADEIAGLDIPEMGAEAYPKDANPTPR